MLKNAPFLITIGVDTAENEPVSDGVCSSGFGGSAALEAVRGPAERPSQASARWFRVPKGVGWTITQLSTVRSRLYLLKVNIDFTSKSLLF